MTEYEEENVLVPTRVGMILKLYALTSLGYTCPHTRGDDPV